MNTIDRTYFFCVAENSYPRDLLKNKQRRKKDS